MDQIAAKVDGVNSKVDGVNSKVDGVNSKMDGLSREVKRARFAADAWYSDIGTPTKTEKGKFVQENGVQIDFQLDLTKTYKTKSPEKFLYPPNMSRDANPKEEKIQDYFMDECKVLENYANIQNKLIIRDTHFSLLLDTRQPDFVFIPSNSPLDLLSVVVVGEIKKRVGESFSNADIGHAISFGKKILQLQPQRNYVYVVLTDCIIINIYKVNRKEKENYSQKYTEFIYNYIKSEYLIYNTQANSPPIGWKYLVTIMESSPERLGWIEPSLKFGEETAEIALHICGRENVEKANYLSCIERERAVLEQLSELDTLHIPKILFHDENTLVMTPLGVKEPILIIDWGFSTKNCEDTAFAGALECMPDLVLESLTNEKNIAYRPK
ncbi:24773_t:CDS:2, partial [Gigaspora margarita]